MKEIKIKVDPKIYPIGQRGSIISDDLLNQIVANTNAKKLIEIVVWRLDNICIDNKFAIIEAYYDIANTEIILHLTDIKNLGCKYHLEDCILCNTNDCEYCIDGDHYDFYNK